MCVCARVLRMCVCVSVHVVLIEAMCDAGDKVKDAWDRVRKELQAEGMVELHAFVFRTYLNNGAAGQEADNDEDRKLLTRQARIELRVSEKITDADLHMVVRNMVGGTACMCGDGGVLFAHGVHHAQMHTMHNACVLRRRCPCHHRLT